MKELCVFCSGEMLNKRVNVSRNWGGHIVLFKGVQAQVCSKCGEEYFSMEIIRKMEEILEKRKRPDTSIHVPVFHLKVA